LLAESKREKLCISAWASCERALGAPGDDGCEAGVIDASPIASQNVYMRLDIYNSAATITPIECHAAFVTNDIEPRRAKNET
jgi:hypothetical protein